MSEIDLIRVGDMNNSGNSDPILNYTHEDYLPQNKVFH